MEKQVKISVSAKDGKSYLVLLSSVTKQLQYKSLVHKCERAFTKQSFHKEKDCAYKAETYLREQKEHLRGVR